MERIIKKLNNLKYWCIGFILIVAGVMLLFFKSIDDGYEDLMESFDELEVSQQRLIELLEEYEHSK